MFAKMLPLLLVYAAGFLTVRFLSSWKRRLFYLFLCSLVLILWAMALGAELTAGPIYPPVRLPLLKA